MKNPYEKLSEADPQMSWWRQIPTPIYRALFIAEITIAETKIAHFIIDCSWGFQRDHCTLARDKICRALGLSLSTTNRALRKLEKQRLIVVERIDGKSNKYLFNKYWKTWLVKWQGDTSVIGDTGIINDTGREERIEANREEDIRRTSVIGDTGIINDTGREERIEANREEDIRRTSVIGDTGEDEDIEGTSVTSDTGGVSPVTRGGVTSDTGGVSPSAMARVAPKDSTLKKVRTKKVLKESTYSRVKRDIYGEFQNVQLSLDEYNKLLQRFGEIDAQNLIEELSSGIASKGYKYKDHYATIINWSKRNGGMRGHHERHEREKSGAGGKWGDFKGIKD